MFSFDYTKTRGFVTEGFHCQASQLPSITRQKRKNRKTTLKICGRKPRLTPFLFSPSSTCTVLREQKQGKRETLRSNNHERPPPWQEAQAGSSGTRRGGGAAHHEYLLAGQDSGRRGSQHVTYLGSGRMRYIGDENPEQEQQEDDEAGMDEEGEEEEDDRSGDDRGSSDDDDEEEEEEAASSEEDPEERARRLAPDVASLACLYQAGGKDYRRAIRSLRLQCCGTEFETCDNLLFTAKRRRLPFGCRDCNYAVCFDCTRFSKCDDCDTPHCRYCNEPMRYCSICGKMRCDDCPHPVYECCQCDESFCDECRPYTVCDDCGNLTCTDCPVEVCDECYFMSCLECPNFMESCVGCDKLVCDGCPRSWTTYCPNQSHTYCDDCDTNNTGGCEICHGRERFF